MDKEVDATCSRKNRNRWGCTSHGEELKGTRGPNSSGGTKKSTILTSKYVLRGKTKKAEIIIRQLK